MAFDNGVPIHRRELSREYKCEKKPTGEVSDLILSSMNKEKLEFSEDKKAFLEQYELVVNILNSMVLPLVGCISVKVRNCEADDIIAYCCKEFSEGEELTIISTDEDLWQLINDNVEVYQPLKKEFYSLLEMEEKGYNPNFFKLHYLLSKAIIGDKSDNIEGITGISKKNAIPYGSQLVNLIEEGKTLDEALPLLKRNFRGSQKALDSLKESPELIKRNFNLMDLGYTEKASPELVSKIRRSLLFFLKVSIDYNKACSKLSELEIPYSEYTGFLGTILDCNVRGNKKELLEKLV